MLFLGLAVLTFCQWMRKQCFFAFFKLAYLMGGCVSLRSDITHFVLMIHALLTQILNYCFGAICRVYCMCYFLPFFRLWSIRQKKETLPKAKRPRGWVQLMKVTWLSHITSSNTNLNQILESLLSTISTKHQHLAET